MWNALREQWSMVVIVAVLAAIVGLPFALRPGVEAGLITGGPNAPRLIIYTPHNEQIRYEFAVAFNTWRQAQGLEPVVFDWRASGGTSDLRRQVLDQFADAASDGREDEGIGVDLFFGGGEYDHNKLAEGINVERDGRTETIAVTVPPRIPDELLAAAFPEPRLGGELLVHPERRWVGVVLSSFGIVYNRDVLATLGVDEPTTWRDLADPRYRGWIALSDPGHSGSIAATYHLILRRQGWNEGWATLRRAFANARYFTASSSKVPVDVSAGEAAAGMCIDFYGRFQAGAIGGDRVGYVDPPGMTAITADPISLLRGAPHRELANQFIVWLLTPEAQALWQLRRDASGGPRLFELRRQPIRRDLYTPEQRARWSDPDIDPFEEARPFPPAMPQFFGLVAPISHAIAIDIHEDLRGAWRAIQASPSGSEERRRMLELFDQMPPELTLTWPDERLAASWPRILEDQLHPRHDEVAAVLDEFFGRLSQRWAGDGDRALRDRSEWTAFFRERYRRIIAMGGR